MLNITLLALLIPLAPGPQVTLRTSSGEEVAGAFNSLTPEAVVIDQQGTSRSVATNTLESLTFATSPATAASTPTGRVKLRDGSEIHFDSCLLASSNATLKLGDATLTIPAEQLSWLWLRGGGQGEDESWRKMVTEKLSSDRLIVRRAAADSGAVSLDAMEGVVREVTATHVLFESEGESLKVKREKLEGVVFYRPAANELKGPIAGILVDTNNSRWMLTTATVGEDRVKITTAGGLAWEFDPRVLGRIDFGERNQMFLTAELLETTLRKSWLPGEPPRRSFFSPKFNGTPHGALRMGGRAFSRGLWIPAVSQLTFRVPEGFNRLSLQVGLDDAVHLSDGARLVIATEKETLWQGDVKPVSEPQVIDVPLNGATRLRLGVEYAGQSKIGDTIILGDAKFTK